MPTPGHSIGKIKNPNSVRLAIAKFEKLGPERFFDKYGFSGATKYYVIENGKRYDAKAIAGMAYNIEFPHLPPLSSIDFNSGPRIIRLFKRLGFVLDGELTKRVRSETDDELENIRRRAEREGDFDSSKGDARSRALRAIVLRQGQGEFRSDLLYYYEGRCAMTGCTVERVLEAAHIAPYQGKYSCNPQNGLLLRADIHTLFDLYFLTITSKMLIAIAPELKGSEYASLHGKPVFIPKNPKARPKKEVLAKHRIQCHWVRS